MISFDIFDSQSRFQDRQEELDDVLFQSSISFLKTIRLRIIDSGLFSCYLGY